MNSLVFPVKLILIQLQKRMIDVKFNNQLKLSIASWSLNLKSILDCHIRGISLN